MSVQHAHNQADYDGFKGTAGKLVVVDFSATWCGPCRFIAPVYEQLAKDNTDVVFVHVDIDELRSANLPDMADVSGVPTFKFFKDGTLLESFSGANKDKLTAAVAKHK